MKPFFAKTTISIKEQGVNIGQSKKMIAWFTKGMK